DEGQVVDRDVDHLIVDDLLDLVELGLALLGVELASLAMIEVVDLWHAAVRVDSVPGGVGLETRRRIAERGRDDQDDAAKLLLPPLGEVGGALHRARLRADADRLEIALDRLGHGVVGRERIEVAALEAVRVPRLGQELLGPRGIVGAWLAASRTRRSCQGDFGSHCSVSSSQKAPERSGATTLYPGAFCSASAVEPVSR